MCRQLPVPVVVPTLLTPVDKHDFIVILDLWCLFFASLLIFNWISFCQAERIWSLPNGFCVQRLMTSSEEQVSKKWVYWLSNITCFLLENAFENFCLNPGINKKYLADKAWSVKKPEEACRTKGGKERYLEGRLLWRRTIWHQMMK